MFTVYHINVLIRMFRYWETCENNRVGHNMLTLLIGHLLESSRSHQIGSYCSRHLLLCDPTPTGVQVVSSPTVVHHILRRVAHTTPTSTPSCHAPSLVGVFLDRGGRVCEGWVGGGVHEGRRLHMCTCMHMHVNMSMHTENELTEEDWAIGEVAGRAIRASGDGTNSFAPRLKLNDLALGSS